MACVRLKPSRAAQPEPGSRLLQSAVTSRKYVPRVRCMMLPPMVAMFRNWALIDKVAMGELIVMVGATAADRIGSAVTAVPVVDAPPTPLVLTWRQNVPAATRDAFVRTAKNVTSGHLVLSVPGA